MITKEELAEWGEYGTDEMVRLVAALREARAESSTWYTKYQDAKIKLAEILSVVNTQREDALFLHTTGDHPDWYVTELLHLHRVIKDES